MSEKSILIIDDSNTIRAGIGLILRQAGVFERFFEASNAEEALRIMEITPPDLIICDIVMPGLDGFEFLKLVKARSLWRDIPVLMLTGQESIDKKIKGLDLGASDYLTKPFDSGELIARVRVQLKVKSLQDELREANSRYMELSITDYLTCIYNRRYYMELFEQEYQRSSRYGQPLSLVIFDVDDFKQVNDTFGHLVGDRVLKHIPELVKPEIRSHDTLARYGGEEFVIMLPQTPQAGAILAAEKIRRKVAEAVFSGVEGRNITLSLGVASLTTDIDRESHELLARADRALYEAKSQGKNRVVFGGAQPKA